MIGIVQIFNFQPPKSDPGSWPGVDIARLKIELNELAERAGFQVEAAGEIRGAVLSIAPGLEIVIQESHASNSLDVRASARNAVNRGVKHIMTEVQKALKLSDNEIDWIPDEARARAYAEDLVNPLPAALTPAPF